MDTKDLTQRHAKAIKGVLHCFDRLVLFGTYKAIGWPQAMAYLLGRGDNRGIIAPPGLAVRVEEFASMVHNVNRMVDRFNELLQSG